MGNQDEAAATGLRTTSVPEVSGSHFPAAVGTSPALAGAVLHVADLLAGAGAVLADIGALGAGVLVVRRTEQHEVRGGPADLGAGEHQTEMLGLNVLAAGRQAVMRGHAKTGLVAA